MNLNIYVSMKVVKVLDVQSFPVFVTSWIITDQVPLSMEFSRQEYWSG